MEELRSDANARPLKEDGSEANSSFRRIRTDTLIGMGFSNIVAFFIMLTTAVTLNMHGVTDIQTSAQAAAALRPIAGEFAFLIFSAGIIGTGLLAVPVLAGSAAYALSGAFRWQNSLEYKPGEAKGFYGIIALSTVLGIGLCFAPIDPIKALYWSAVINGVISIPIMAVMMLMAARRDVMGGFVIDFKLKLLGWGCVVIMAVAVAAMLATWKP